MIEHGVSANQDKVLIVGVGRESLYQTLPEALEQFAEDGEVTFVPSSQVTGKASRSGPRLGMV